MKFGTVIACAPLLLVLTGCGSTEDGAKAPKPKAALSDVSIGPEQMAAKEGIPLYPGSQAPSGESTITPGASETRYELVMVTPDSIGKVADFYKRKIAGLDGKVTGETADFMGMTAVKIPVHITMGVKAGKTVVRAAAVVASNSEG